MNVEKLKQKLSSKSSLKIGLISDTHYAVHRRNNVFFPHMIKATDEFITQCKENEVDLVIHTGDVFDTKNQIATEGLINTNELITEISKFFPLIMIPGNHDFAYTEHEEINLVSNYKEYDNILVLFNYTKIEFPKAGMAFHFLPYQKVPEPELKKIKKSKDLQNILFSHFGIHGFKVHAYASEFANQISAEVSKDSLKRFDKVFTGHYHGHQSKDNVVYVSSPLQSRHGDEHSKHGFVIWNTDNKNHKFILNEHTPQFITYELTKDNAKKMLELKDHYIRIKVKKKVSKELIITLKRKLLKENYDVVINFEIEDDSTLAVVKDWKSFILADPDMVIIDYINKLDEQKELEFDKVKLLKLLDISLK